MAITAHHILEKYGPAVANLGLHPQQLLTGTGKVHRYVEIKTADASEAPAMKALITAAVAAYKQRIA